MEFTNQQLIVQAREEVDFWRERDEFIPSQQTAIRLRLAEIAMVALMTPEPEPVADVVAWSSPSEERTCDIRWRRHDVKPGPLYTAPPAPVVPEEATPGSIEILASIRPPHGVAYQWDEKQRHAAADAWNACRAAMLQGDHRDLSYPVDPQIAAYEKIMEQAIPDGYALVPIIPTEEMIINGFEAELREEFRDPEALETYEKMSGCELAAHRTKLCWAAMIAAAPQQERKI